MEPKLFETLGQIAGIGGIGLGVLLLVFRDVIRRTIFSQLTRDHSYRLLRLIVVLTFFVAIIGLGTWAALKLNAPSSISTKEEVVRREHEIRKPIDALFTAWETKDLDAYLRQWDATAVQQIGSKKIPLAEIAEKRKIDFNRYKIVEVLDHRVEVEDPFADPAILHVTYSMRYEGTDGTSFQETEIRESYRVRFDRQKQCWLIIKNYDYISEN